MSTILFIFTTLVYSITILCVIITLGCYLNGKRFAFRQNEYILRSSSISEVIHMENKTKGTLDAGDFD